MNQWKVRIQQTSNVKKPIKIKKALIRLAPFSCSIGEKISLRLSSFWFLFYLNAFQSFNNSNEIYFPGHKYVLGHSQSSFQPLLSSSITKLKEAVIVCLELYILLSWQCDVSTWGFNHVQEHIHTVLLFIWTIKPCNFFQQLLSVIQ